MQFEYSVESRKNFDDTVRAVEQKTAEKGFRVLHIHDVAATLAEKGFQREPLKIVEVCNARYASQVLEKDVKIALMLPCPIAVYRQGSKTFISTMLPSAMTAFYPHAGIGEVADAVEKVVTEIVNESGR